MYFGKLQRFLNKNCPTLVLTLPFPCEPNSRKTMAKNMDILYIRMWIHEAMSWDAKRQGPWDRGTVGPKEGLSPKGRFGRTTAHDESALKFILPCSQRMLNNCFNLNFYSFEIILVA